jgi:hypothetical protein
MKKTSNVKQSIFLDVYGSYCLPSMQEIDVLMATANIMVPSGAAKQNLNKNIHVP